MFFKLHHRGPANLILSIAGIFLLLNAGCQSYQKSYRDPVDNIRRMEPEEMHQEELPEEPQGVPAPPDTISYEQPDGYVLDIFLRGDEYHHVAMTTDGFYLVFNEDEFYEYAIKDEEGTLLTTGIIARNKEDRPEEIQRFLENLATGDNDP